MPIRGKNHGSLAALVVAKYYKGDDDGDREAGKIGRISRHLGYIANLAGCVPRRRTCVNKGGGIWTSEDHATAAESRERRAES